MIKFSILIFIIGIAHSDIFTLYDTRQADHETNCSRGLINNKDVVVFKSSINLTEDSQYSTANFEIQTKENRSLFYICDLVITKDCSGKGQDTGKCPCKRLGKTIVQIEIRVIASIRYNGALVHGNLQSTKGELIRRTVHFPEVFESNNTFGFLVINGKIEYFNESLCETDVDGLSLTVEFTCQSPASPCLIEMWTNDTYTAVNGINNIYDKKMFTKMDSLHFTDGWEEGATDGMDSHAVITIVFGLIIAILIAVLVLTYYKKILKLLKNEKKPCCNIFKHKKFAKSNDVKESLEDASVKMNLSDPASSTNDLDNDQMDSNNEIVESSINESSVKRDSLLDSSGLKKKGNTLDNMSSRSSQSSFSKFEEDPTKIEILHCEDGVIGLKKHYKSCKKRKYHDCFISIEDLECKHLPVEFQGDDMFKELIISMVHLTVLLTVSVAKDVNTSRHLKIGNGWVGSLTKYDNDELNPTCGCKKCISSYNPSKTYANIVIYTTTYVVQNDKEAKSTTCRLFYDKSDSEMTTIADVNEECEISVEQKKCKLTFVTCNTEIIEKLNNASLNWFARYTKVNKRHTKNRDEHKAVIIVSHIHGLHKRIAIGKWIDRKEHTSSEYGKITRYIYNTPTCSGSAGAYVYIVSRDKKGWLSQHFHHGMYKITDKFCGVGTDYGPHEKENKN